MSTEVIKNKEDYVTDYVTYAETMLKKYSRYRELVKKQGEIDILETNKALADYKQVMEFLIQEYEKKALELDLIKNKFDQWYAEKYVAEKDRLNPTSLASGKWSSTKEIEMYVIKNNKEEYNKKKNITIVLSREVATLRRLCEAYKRMDGVFQTLSSNFRAELKSGSLENRMNSDYEKKDNNVRKVREVR